MSVHILLADGRDVHATVSGNFDFQSSRELLLGVRREWTPGAQVAVRLRNVTQTSSCAIGAMVLLSEMAGKDFHVRLESCASEVHGLFDSGLLDRYFRNEALSACGECLAGLRPVCEVPVEVQPLLAAS